MISNNFQVCGEVLFYIINLVGIIGVPHMKAYIIPGGLSDPRDPPCQLHRRWYWPRNPEALMMSVNRTKEMEFRLITVQGTNISNLWKRKIIFPTTFKRDMLVSRTDSLTSDSHTENQNTPRLVRQKEETKEGNQIIYKKGGKHHLSPLDPYINQPSM